MFLKNVKPPDFLKFYLLYALFQQEFLPISWKKIANLLFF